MRVPSVGLVVPGPRGRETAGGLAGRLIDTGVPGVGLDVVDLADGAARDRDGYVLLVGQYGPVPAPEAEDVVTRCAARWAGRPVGLVAYGGVSRGRDAAARVRRLLTELDADVLDVALGVNVAELRGAGGPGVVEVVAWEMLLDAVARACVRTAAPG